MGKYITKRILLMIPVVLGVTVLLFTILYFTPGDPATIILGSTATQADIEELREAMGLNRPYLERLLEYMKNVFLKFDFGESFITGKSIAAEVAVRFPRTFKIALGSICITLLLGIPLGILAAVKQDKLADRITLIASLIGVSMPSFWMGLMLSLLFGLKLGWLPTSGIGGMEYYILPITANCLGGVAGMIRQTRASMLDVIRADYIKTARAKGVSQLEVIFRHALPNALIPIITIAGGNFGRMLGGTIIIESVFGFPGMGTYVQTAINNRDYDVVLGTVVILSISFSIIMLIVDLIYAFVDPRIKAQYEGKKGR